MIGTVLLIKVSCARLVMIAIVNLHRVTGRRPGEDRAIEAERQLVTDRGGGRKFESSRNQERESLQGHTDARARQASTKMGALSYFRGYGSPIH